MTIQSAKRVDNSLQGELFDLTLLLMPTTKSVTEPKNEATTAPRVNHQRSRELGNPREPREKREKREQGLLHFPADPPVRVVKSKRRKRHIAAYRQSGEIVISVPYRTTRAEISALIPEMVARVIAGEERGRRSESELEARAATLLTTYLPEFSSEPASINWRTMQERWGSCTTVDRTIRISDRLRAAPEYVIDCVLFHELIHLEIPGHGQDFHALLARYPELQRAEAFLEGYEAGERGC